jgi:hypothetical protein
MIFYFGSWERRSNRYVYMILARCDCTDLIHRQEYMLSTTELEMIRFDPFPMIKAKMDNKFRRIHQVAINL